MLNVECRCCKENTEKRVVIKRNPLQKMNVNLPNGYKELYCENIIKTKRIWKKIGKGKNIYKWTTEECRNHILVKKKRVLKSMNKEPIEEKEFISYEKAIEMLPEKDRIHTIRQGRGPFHVGADRSKENVLELMKQFQDTLELTGPKAREIDHRIVLRDNISVLFIETKEV